MAAQVSFASVFRKGRTIFVLICGLFALSRAQETDTPALRKAFIDGSGPGWQTVTEQYFTKVNCDPDTFRWTNGTVYCKGQPIGVIRSVNLHTNFEMVAEWRHLKSAGNSEIFVWATPESIQNLEAGKGRFPIGIEVQVLDHGYKEAYEKSSHKKADWFTTNGDVFPTGSTKMKPFPPISPAASGVFPAKI